MEAEMGVQQVKGPWNRRSGTVDSQGIGSRNELHRRGLGTAG